MSSSANPRGLTRWLLAGNGGLVLLFLYAPIILLVVFSFSGAKDPGVWGGFTFDWYRDLADDDRRAIASRCRSRPTSARARAASLPTFAARRRASSARRARRSPISMSSRTSIRALLRFFASAT